MPIDWLAVAYTMLLSRRMDELEEQVLTPQGKVKYQFSAKGHELVQVLTAQFLTHPHDAATVYYRSRPFVLASGLTPGEALAANMARDAGPSRGRDAGVMFHLPSRGRATVLPSSGDVGAQYPTAAGWAHAIRYRVRVLHEPEWRGAIAVAMGGDGSVASNGFWAALNVVTTARLPMLFVIEDNQFGISVPSHLQTPGGNIAVNLASYGNLEIWDGPGYDPAETARILDEAIRYVRSGEGPALVRLEVPRLSGHTFTDNQAYKSPERREWEEAHDPIPYLRGYLLEQGLLTSADWDALVQRVEQDLKEALAWAEAQPEPDPAQVTRYVFFEGEPPVMGGLRPEGALPPMGHDEPRPPEPRRRINFVDAVLRVLETEMARNPRIAVFGEDVAVKGGVHGATRGLWAHFGSERVFDTPLNETGIVGRAVGMALAGLLPVPEIQFRKYADPAREPIHDLGFLRWRTANQFAAPLVLRMPVGFGKVTGDPWHSFSAEQEFVHMFGWRIAYPSNAADAAGLLRTALRGDDPVIFLEHRALLDTAVARRPYPGDDYCLPFGRAARLQEGRRLTVVTWGAMVPRVLEAAQSWPGEIEVLDLRTLIPWDQEAVLDSVRRTGRLLIVHEDGLTGGFGGEIAAVVMDEAFEWLDAPIRRVAAPDVPVPYNIGLMHAVVPTVERIRQAIEALLAW
ncbi:MAG: pyruvate dehydrogenase [Chloroflexi bacterium]|nr:pyruvate dehydrogenase [Chloroflexota bacterium]